MDALHLIQLSDLHLKENAQDVLLGVNTRESFQAVLELVQQEEKKIDGLFLSGDLSQDGSLSSYADLAGMLDPLHKPIYAVPGNHDEFENMAAFFPMSSAPLLLNEWQIILLNSQKRGFVQGFLQVEQLRHLENCLRKFPHHHALILLHHHPVLVGSTWLDQIGLKNAERFWQIIYSFPQVKAIFFGHVHQEFSMIKQGVQCFSAPSTCIQFKSKQAHFCLAHLPPGYRRIQLYPDGQIVTGVIRVAHYVGFYDADAKGYK